MRLQGRHGVAEQEREVGAEYELRLRLGLGVPAGVTTDDVADTVNYADVWAVAKREFAIPSKLIEHVGTRIGEALLREFNALQRVDLELIKVSPPIPGFNGSAAVEIIFEK